MTHTFSKMKQNALAKKTVLHILDVLGDLLRGGRHSRVTVARFGVSLPTADRWLEALETRIPGLRRVKIGRVAWLESSAPPRLFLKLCNKCHERVHAYGTTSEDPGTAPRELCDDCTAKLAQCARILTSSDLDAAIVTAFEVRP